MSATRRAERRAAIRGFRRAQLLEAAQGVFMERGLDGATMRAIAEAAGCAVGTLYLHFADKEAMYAALLEDSLDELAAQVRAAGETETDPHRRARTVLGGMYSFYAARPDELELGLYLFGGARRRGLGPEADRRLNAGLEKTIDLKIGALRAIAPGLDDGRARAIVAGLLAETVGALILQATGRLKLLAVSARELVARRVEVSIAETESVLPPGREKDA
ncbi:MAG: hypothetical protein TEF_13255 [Rhizobiales bacterium NRL2]|jgi:AcrR family transcriptional regulator|nr:MAG: hypothetical protein TEF_13255 [Rhizobiales bacterium NRL2]